MQLLGFASGPPFSSNGRPIKRSRSAEEDGDPWVTTLMERQKQQQMALIEQELNVMAQATQCGIGKWRFLSSNFRKGF